MVRNDSLFYLSGFISFLTFGAVIALFSYVLIVNDTIKNFALVKDNYISVSIDMIPISTKQKSVTKPKEPKKITTKTAPTKPLETLEESKPVDINSLFSDVSTKKVVHKKRAPVKQIDTKQIKQIQKRIKTSTTKRDTTASKKIAAMKLASISSEALSGSSALEVNEYLAKIQAKVYEHFYPPLNSEGNSAKIRIWLSAAGSVNDFRVLAYSGHDLFNEEVDALKMRLSRITFPLNPDNRSLSIDIILMAKE